MRQIFIIALAFFCSHTCISQVFSPPVSAATLLSPGVYNLTPTGSSCASPYAVGAIWCTTTIDFSNSFTLTFEASIDHAVGRGADGICVDFGQNITTTSFNGTNAFLGYYNTIGSPANPDFNQSFGVEFDIFDNSYNPAFISDIPGTDHTAICPNAVMTTPCPGGGPASISPTRTNIKDGLYHRYKIEWCPATTTMKVYYEDTLRINSVYNYASLFTTPGSVHWGFSGGTGAECSNQILKNIVLTTGAAIGTGVTKDTTLCAGSGPITLWADSVGNYLWSTGATSSTIVVSSTGTYWVKISPLTCGADRIDTFHVNYSAVLPLNLGNDTSICVGGSITLAPVIPSGSSLTWSTGATGPSIVVNTAGTYWANISSGGCTGADTINVTIKPIPPVHLGPDVMVCEGTAISLQSSDTYVSPAYLWSNGNTTAGISPTTSATYILHVTEGGCTGADTVNVLFKPIPQVKLGNDTIICLGNSIVLSSKEPANAQYYWNTGSTDSSIVVSAAGTYQLTVTTNGCTATGSINVTLGTNASIDIGPDTVLCIGESVVLSINNANAIWSNHVQGSSIHVDYPGKYWVTVQDACGDISDTINVDFHICDIGFPSAFTPNGDGKNDNIGVEGTLKYYRNFAMSMYNRWGERVFYTEDIYGRWDGIYNGAKQDLGTYFYMIFYSFEGHKHMMKGDFQLIR